jgi:hypothetical protein
MSRYAASMKNRLALASIGSSFSGSFRMLLKLTNAGEKGFNLSGN